MSNGTVPPKCRNKAPRFSSSSFRNELIDGNESMGKFNDNVILIIYKQLLQVHFAFHNYKVCPPGKKVNRNRINKCIFNLINSSMKNKINRYLCPTQNRCGNEKPGDNLEWRIQQARGTGGSADAAHPPTFRCSWFLAKAEKFLFTTIYRWL